MFRDFLNVYFEILKTENYGYLVVVIPISVFILYKLLINEFEIEGINIFRLLVSITLFLFSILFYSLGDITNELFLEFKAFSVICLLWSSLALFLRPRSFAIGYLSIATTLIFVPIPKQAIDYLSSVLIPALTSIVSTITSTHVVEREGMLMILVKDATNINHLYEVASVRSIVTSILSILTLLPFILYFAFVSRSSKKRKVVYIFATFVINALVVFLGNLLKLTLVIELTKHMGSNVALNSLHYISSIIYIIIATFLTIYSASKMLLMPKIDRFNSLTTIKFVKPLPSFYLAIAVYLILLVMYIITIPLVSAAALTQFSASVLNLPQLLDKPSILIPYPSNTSALFVIPEPKIGEVLSIPNVKRVFLNYSNAQFVGYIEVADTPTKFYGWYVCVMLQGFDVEKSWVEVGSIPIYHMVISKNRLRLLLSYTIYRLLSPEGVTYVRLSFITLVDEYNIHERIENIRSVLGNVKIIDGKTPLTGNAFEVLMISVNIFAAINIVLLILYTIGKFVGRKGVRILVGVHR